MTTPPTARGLRCALAIGAAVAIASSPSCQPVKGDATRAATRDDRGAVRAGAQTGLELLRWFVPSDPKRRKDGIDEIATAAPMARAHRSPRAVGGVVMRALSAARR
jgi:hypothetical protein